MELGYCQELPIWDVEDKRQALVFIADNEPMFVGGILIVDRVSQVTVLPHEKVILTKMLCLKKIRKFFIFLCSNKFNEIGK